MNQHLHSPTKLTEFARDFEDDEPESLLGRFVNKIQNVYNQSYNTVNEVATSVADGTVPAQVSKSVFYADRKIDPNSGISFLRDNFNSNVNIVTTNVQPTNTFNAPANKDTSASSSTPTSSSTPDELNGDPGERIQDLPAEASEGRTMVNVLKRMSSLMATKNSDLRNYRDTELHRFWMPDSKAKECYDCAQRFSTFRRKHHCRLCGQIFCSKCCNQVVPGKIIMCAGELKVCNYCSKIVLSYLKSTNIAVDLHADLQALQQDLTQKLEDKNENSKKEGLPVRANLARKISVGYQEERFATHVGSNLSVDDRKNILQQSNSLITLHEEMRRQLPGQDCGTHLIEYLITHNKSSNKVQAVAILNAMLAAGFLQPIVPDSDQIEFDESLHYKFIELHKQCITNVHIKDPNLMSESNSPQIESSGELQPPKSLDVSLSFHSLQDMELEYSMRSTTTTTKLLESYCDYEEQLLTQMLRTFQLDLRWSKVLMSLCCRAANHFKPEYCTNDLMDIRNYVNIKKIPGGKRQECTIVGGVVFSKNIAHKDMATRVEHPRILLLQCPIVYERIEGKFVSISTVLLQEKEYLRRVCDRIMSFKPNVVLVHKNVAGVAQDMLRSQGITLVLDLKLSVMERISRTLQCDIVTSIESNIARPQLGTCDAFYIRSFNDGSGSNKTLMFFEKLNNPRGFTCLLRGGTNKELAKVKKVASFLVYARYNWRLEMSFLLDEFADPLIPKPPIFNSKEPSPVDLPSDEDDQIIHAKPAIERKVEEKILLQRKEIISVSENVADFTDPLRSAEITTNKVSVDRSVIGLAVESRYDNRFRTALSSTLLSVSPFLSFPLPYLETEQGRKCSLRPLFPTELYYSKLWSDRSNLHLDRHESLEQLKNTINENMLKSPHPFLKIKITTPWDNRDIQTLLAEFRACGGRYPKKKKMLKELIKVPQKVAEDYSYKDALDLENHQRLPVLFCSFYFNPKSASSFCAPPTLLDMKFYGQHDIMLGQFLQRYCCRLNSMCRLCNLPMLGHVRRYVHSMGCVQVFLSEDNIKTDPNRIYFTAWCTICNEMTPSVPLSDNTKCLSFAKYLELRFHGHAYKKRQVIGSNSPGITPSCSEVSRCQHSLHRDYVHYFTYRGVGAKFQYTPIEVWDIGLPELVLGLQPSKVSDQFKYLEEIKNFSMKGHEVYTRIHERIADLATEDDTLAIVLNLKTALSKDQFIFKQHIEIVQTLLADPKSSVHDVNDALLMSKRVLAESIDLWGPRVHDIALAQKAAAKQSHTDSGTICTEDLRPEYSDAPQVVPELSHLITTTMVHDDTSSNAEDNVGESESESQNNVHIMMEKKSSVDQLLTTSASTDKKSIKKILTQLLPSAGPSNLLQSPFSAQEHYTLSLGAFPILVHDQDLSSLIAYSLTSSDYQRFVANLASNSFMVNNAGAAVQVANIDGANNTPAANQNNPSPNLKRKSQESSQEGDENDKKEFSNNNVNADEERNKLKAHSSHIELTFQDNGTQFTCKIYFAREFDLMRAKTLKPPSIDKSLYKEIEQSKKREELKVSQSRSGPEMELVRKPSDVGMQADTNKPNSSGRGDDKTSLQSEIEKCRNYLARSLCSSVQWEARGGKSGSRFCKTLDDRFVLKEMTKSDINIFENFAPNYFEYISKCQQQNQPTLLAKIFGVFKVIIKKKDSSVEKSLLVMENLFFGCDIKNKFDLKGSERNRLVDPSDQQGEIVLLDENLVQMSWSKPLYILSHSKSVLKDAINRDATFLEKNQVMDYSLLVGLDHKNNVLVLGIIDYIRTFTFDKRVESFVKQTGILGGMGKLPTVISPERYRQRFIDAMDRYFYTVPDRWEGLSKT
ncbi:putative 1-phosphatidylinositol 3-phosphate 5-kinase isoform X1 [Anastrepha obliqua]|uniref:putative 1-phosphatidylinositol 3-phosphate 5-kinase isoform X1 n=1 Tax=Anastrepha obliqua TaxID=95512 RepID=UPI002408FCD5|nr:putative 1-phosphatidylinositol 3-phosphate 5-kinase isoform X1 [Anastrepha obliqua]